MNLLDEVFQIDEVISEGDTPVECFEWVLGEVLCLYVTIHTDVIEDVLQIARVYSLMYSKWNCS